MGILHLEFAKQLRKEGKRLGRAGLSQRVIKLVSRFDGSYKEAMTLAGRLKAITQAAKFDGYWDEKCCIGFQKEYEEIQNFESTIVIK